MKIKCEKCSHSQDITCDIITFDDEDEKVFVSYLAAELIKSKDSNQTE